MGFVAHSPPNFDAAEKSLGVTEGPVVTQAFGHLPLFSQVRPSAESYLPKFICPSLQQVNGIMNMVS